MQIILNFEQRITKDTEFAYTRKERTSVVHVCTELSHDESLSIAIASTVFTVRWTFCPFAFAILNAVSCTGDKYN